MKSRLGAAFLLEKTVDNLKRTVIDLAAKETELVVNGETYKIRYNFDALAGFEEGTGINPAIQPISPTLFNLMCLLYAGLHQHHPDLAIETVKSWFNESASEELCKVAWESFYGALRKSDTDKGDAPPNPLSA